MKSKAKGGWGVTAALWALSLVPLVAGLVRIVSLAHPTALTEENARFVASPVPVVVHVVASLFYCVVGALQFNPRFREANPARHRALGRPTLIAGLLAALSGVWMTVFYTIPPTLQGPLLQTVRLAVGIGMSAALWMSWQTIRRRDFAGHRAWTMRAYALGQGAGTQVVIMLPLIVASGPVLGLKRDVLMSLAWCLNLAVAEIIARRKTG